MASQASESSILFFLFFFPKTIVAVSTSRRRVKDPVVSICLEHMGQRPVVGDLFSARRMDTVLHELWLLHQEHKILYFVKDRSCSLPDQGIQGCESAHSISKRSARPARHLLYSEHLAHQRRVSIFMNTYSVTDKPITPLYNNTYRESAQVSLASFLSLLFLSSQDIFGPNSIMCFLNRNTGPKALQSTAIAAALDYHLLAGSPGN